MELDPELLSELHTIHCSFHLITPIMPAHTETAGPDSVEDPQSVTINLNYSPDQKRLTRRNIEDILTLAINVLNNERDTLLVTRRVKKTGLYIQGLDEEKLTLRNLVRLV